MIKEDHSPWEAKYIMRLMQYFDEYPKVFVVTADNVSSRQMQQIRVSLRGQAIVVMGKNTMMRKAIRGQVSKNANLEKLLPYIYENVGLIFTKDDLRVIQKKILTKTVAVPARAGAIAPVDVTIRAQITNIGPERISFFLRVQPTKITRGKIEIMNDVNLIKAGDKVGASEATLLNMLNILPFSYGLAIRQIYDSGCVFPPSLLDIDVHDRCIQGFRRLTAFSLGINYLNQAAASHLLLGGFRNLLALTVETDVEFEQAKTLKYPSRFTAVAATQQREQIESEPKFHDDDDDAMDGINIFA